MAAVEALENEILDTITNLRNRNKQSSKYTIYHVISKTIKDALSSPIYFWQLKAL